MSNSITAFFKGRAGVAESVYQYDYGKVLIIDGLSLPATFEVHFTTSSEDDAITQIGQNNRVVIPDGCINKPGTVTAYIYLHTGENDGETEYVIKFAVIRRARPDYDEDDKSDWESAASQALAMLQNSKKVNTPLDEYNQVDNGTAGQLLRTKGDGSTEWVDEGLPTDEQTATAVSAWLDNHPEATTTVQDGSLTEAKFTDELKLKTIKDYVTPEMFGAKGDGTTDDSDALQDALDNANIINLNGKKYGVSKPLTIDDASRNVLIFNGEIDCIDVFETGVKGVIDAVSVNELRFVSVTIDGKNVTTIAPSIFINGIIARNCNKLIVDNCIIKNCAGNGIYTTTDTKIAIINNCECSGNQIHGIASSAYEILSISDCNLHDNLGQGFDAVYYGGVYETLKSQGIKPIARISNTIIKNNGSGTNESGVYYASGGKIVCRYITEISNCSFIDNGASGTLGQQLRIGNLQEFNPSAKVNNGIVKVHNCFFSGFDNKTKAIYNCEPCELIEISNCKFEGTSDDALIITSEGKLDNNSFAIENDVVGITLYCSHCTIENNSFALDGTRTKEVIKNIANSSIPFDSTNKKNTIINNHIVGSTYNVSINVKGENTIIENNSDDNENSLINIYNGSTDTQVGLNNFAHVRNSGQNTKFNYVGKGDGSDRSYWLWTNGTLEAGALWFNTTDNTLYAYNGSAWNAV